MAEPTPKQILNINVLHIKCRRSSWEANQFELYNLYYLSVIVYCKNVLYFHN